MMDYGTMRGDKVLDYALQLIAQKEWHNVVTLPGLN